MKILGVCWLLVLALAPSAWARLGETLDQLTVRYGKPVREALNSHGNQLSLEGFGFRKTGFVIHVSLAHGVTIREIYLKDDGEDLGEDEIRKLLKINSNDQIWKQADPTHWKKEDGAIATLENNKYLVVQSAESVSLEAELTKENRASSLDGF